MTQPSLERGLPAAPDAERSILGAILLDNGLIYEASAKLCEDNFSLDAHRRIFARMCALHEQSRPIDQITLLDELNRTKELEAVGGISYLAGLTDRVPRRTSIEHYTKIVLEKSRLRSLIHVCNGAMAQLMDESGSSTEIAAAVEEAILMMNANVEGFRHIGEVMQDAVDKLAVYRESAKDGTLGLTTTLQGVDDATTGIRDDEFWVIGARPNVGKTPFAMQVAIANAIKGLPVLVFSLEMRDTQLAWRCISHAGIARPRHVRDPRYIDGAIWHNITDAPNQVKDWPLWVDDTAVLSLKELKHKARYAVARYGVKLIVVDYLQLVTAPGKSSYEKVSAVARGLQQLCRQTHCPVLALSQLNREAKDLTREPNMGDLRESGEIEQSANVVGILHRPPDPRSGESLPGINGKFIAAKVREGAGGPIDVHFDIDTLTFKEGWRAERN